MKLIVFAAFFALCEAAKLDRSYLPPSSANNAGGSPGAIQTPFSSNQANQEQGNQVDQDYPRNQENQINQGNLAGKKDNQGFQGSQGIQRNQVVQGSQGNQGLGGIPRGGFSNEFQGVVVDAAAPGTRASGLGESGLGAPRQNYGSQNSRVGEAAFRDVPSNGFRQEYQNEQANEIQSQPAQPQVERFNQPSFNVQPVQNQRANAEQDRAAEILRQENEIESEKYMYNFENSNGIRAEQSGVASNGNEAQGGFEYVGDDGQTYSLTYTAGEGGYKPVASYLPTPPPIPEAILKSLEQNAKDEAAGIKDDGSYDSQRYNAGGDYNESNNNGQYNRGSSDRVVPTFNSFVNQNSARQQVVSNNNNVQNVQPTVNRNNFVQQQQNVGYLPPTQQFKQQVVQQQPQRQPGVPQSVNNNAAPHRHITIINKYGSDVENSMSGVSIQNAEQNKQAENNQVAQPAAIKDDAYYYRQPVEAFESSNLQQQNNQVSQPNYVVQQNLARPSYQAQQVSAPVEVAQPANNGVTQATISSFSSSSNQYNGQQANSQLAQNEIPRPNYQQQNPQRPQSFSPQRPAVQQQSFEQRPSNQQLQVERLSSPQYNGEIYQYNKPAQTLPPPDATPQSSIVVPSQAAPDNKQLAGNQFGGRPVNQQNQFVAQQPQQQNKINLQPQQSQFNVQRQQQATELELSQSNRQTQQSYNNQQQVAQPQQKFNIQPQQSQYYVQQNVEPQQNSQFQQNRQPQQSYYIQQQKIAQSQQNAQFQQNIQPQQNGQYQLNVQRQQNHQSQQSNNNQQQQIAQPQQNTQFQQNIKPQQNGQFKQNVQRQQNIQSQQSNNNQPQQIAQPQQNAQFQQNIKPQQNGQLQQNVQPQQKVQPQQPQYNTQPQKNTQVSGQNEQFGNQFQGQQSSGPSQLSSSPVAGQGEQFGGPRHPPSFNQETGYQY